MSNTNCGKQCSCATAKTFADMLVDSYHAQRVKYPHLNTICIDLFDNYPEDSVMEQAIAMLDSRWLVEPREFDASPGRAGCVWMTPKFPVS